VSEEARSIRYQPPGPVAAEFHKSEAFVRGLKGPVGSGKSSTCVMEIIRHSMRQKPFNGVRRARWAVIRNTYPELKSTTIKTWQSWVPDDLATIKWDAPITATLKIKDCGDGAGLELEVIFIALDKASETGKLRSLELTGAWINEASEVPREVFDMVTQRVGRFPAKREGGPVHPCVIMDTNPPDDDHFWYKLAEEDRPANYEFFDQPGGLVRVVEGEEVRYEPNPLAENVFNLPQGYVYYLNMVGGKTDDWIKVFVLGQYGTTADGKPVYPEYNDRVHVADNEIAVNPALPIYLGWDFGLTPACIIGQMSPKGQLLILDELVAEDMGIRQFAAEVVKPVLLNKYSRNRIESVGDPAGMNRAQTDERTCFQELLEAGIATEPANTNDFIPRRESVAFYLNRMAGGEPGFLLSPNCRQLRKGFLGGYRYERLKVAGERYRDRPVKDRFSHPHDALQYLCLKVRDGGGLRPRAKTIRKASSKGWT
jgi:hypothetical protein